LWLKRRRAFDGLLIITRSVSALGKIGMNLAGH
jgi:hypothetical protein